MNTLLKHITLFELALGLLVSLNLGNNTHASIQNSQDSRKTFWPPVPLPSASLLKLMAAKQGIAEMLLCWLKTIQPPSKGYIHGSNWYTMTKQLRSCHLSLKIQMQPWYADEIWTLIIRCHLIALNITINMSIDFLKNQQEMKLHVILSRKSNTPRIISGQHPLTSYAKLKCTLKKA